jgi:hypothetical protein
MAVRRDLRVPGVVSAWVALPAVPDQRIKSPLPPYQIGTPTVGLCRSVRDSTVFDAGVCPVVPDRSMTYEQPPSNHRRQSASGLRRSVRCDAAQVRALGCRTEGNGRDLCVGGGQLGAGRGCVDRVPMICPGPLLNLQVSDQTQ